MVLFPQNLRNDETLFGDFRCLVECLFGCEEGFNNVLTHGGVDGVRVAHGFDAGRAKSQARVFPYNMFLLGAKCTGCDTIELGSRSYLTAMVSGSNS